MNFNPNIMHLGICEIQRDQNTRGPFSMDNMERGSQAVSHTWYLAHGNSKGEQEEEQTLDYRKRVVENMEKRNVHGHESEKLPNKA